MIALLFIAALLAFLVSAVAGGGAGLVLVPILRAVVPISGVPAALSIGTAASSVSRGLVFRRSVRWPVVWRFVPMALPGAAFGAWLLSRIEPAYAELVIACFLLANLPALFRRPKPEPDGKPPLSHGILPAVGALAGVLSGFTGAVGLLFNGIYKRLGLDRHEIVATRAVNEVTLHLLKIVLYAWFGLLTASVIVAGIVVAVAAIAASLLARWVLPRINDALFYRAGHVAMVAAGGAMFFLSSGQIAQLHRAWVDHVAPGGENELRLFWGGEQVAALEWEPEGYPAWERTVALSTLPKDHRARLAASVPGGRKLTMIEHVRTPHKRFYEVYYRSAEGGMGKQEIALD